MAGRLTLLAGLLRSQGVVKAADENGETVTEMYHESKLCRLRVHRNAKPHPQHNSSAEG